MNYRMLSFFFFSSMGTLNIYPILEHESIEKRELILAELISTIPLIAVIEQRELDKACLHCIKCGKTLPCAEFTGHLIGGGFRDMKKLQVFKRLLSKRNGQEICVHMKVISNEIKIGCPICEQFIGWEE